ncbi:MAG: hypothetical protein ACREBW_10290 [Candidatus Micrarchaeaceae archaeon]
MPVEGISGAGVAALAVGGILAWSGIKGNSVSATTKDILSGKDPRTQTPTQTVSPGGLISSLFGGSAIGSVLGIGGSGGGSGGTFHVTGPGNTSANAAQNQATASKLLPRFGWSQSQMGPLTSLWNQESGWNQHALNAGSGATGIPQLLPSAHKIPANWSNPLVQILWGLNYIKQTYGSPAAAWAHEQQFNWY